MLLQAVTSPCHFRALEVSDLWVGRCVFQRVEAASNTGTVLSNQVRKSLAWKSKRSCWFFNYLNVVLINLVVLINGQRQQWKKGKKFPLYLLKLMQNPFCCGFTTTVRKETCIIPSGLAKWIPASFQELVVTDINRVAVFIYLFLRVFSTKGMAD